MLPDRVSNPGPLTYESGALPIALRGPAKFGWKHAHIYTELNCKTCLVHRKQAQQRGLMQNSDIIKMPKS